MKTFYVLMVIMAPVVLAANVTITVPNSIVAEATTLCDAKRTEGPQYSAAAWSTTACAQAIFNEGLDALKSRVEQQAASAAGAAATTAAYDAAMASYLSAMLAVRPTLAVCGDGNIDTEYGESCDDGNTADGDACPSNCKSQLCGDTVIDPGETCDDGNRTDGDGCSATCQTE